MVLQHQLGHPFLRGMSGKRARIPERRTSRTASLSSTAPKSRAAPSIRSRIALYSDQLAGVVSKRRKILIGI